MSQRPLSGPVVDESRERASIIEDSARSSGDVSVTAITDLTGIARRIAEIQQASKNVACRRLQPVVASS